MKKPEEAVVGQSADKSAINAVSNQKELDEKWLKGINSFVAEFSLLYESVIKNAALDEYRNAQNEVDRLSKDFLALREEVLEITNKLVVQSPQSLADFKDTYRQPETQLRKYADLKGKFDNFPTLQKDEEHIAAIKKTVVGFQNSKKNLETYIDKLNSLHGTLKGLAESLHKNETDLNQIQIQRESENWFVRFFKDIWYGRKNQINNLNARNEEIMKSINVVNTQLSDTRTFITHRYNEIKSMQTDLMEKKPQFDTAIFHLKKHKNELYYELTRYQGELKMIKQDVDAAKDKLAPDAKSAPQFGKR